MKTDVNGSAVYVATGGKPFDPALPVVVFLHGSGGDHRTWALQTRWFAFHGYSVVAPDLPAHSLSSGDPLISIEQSADWLQNLFAAVGVESAHLVGHSQGFLTALEFARRQPDKVKSLAGIGTAAAIPVNPALINTAKKSVSAATEMMLQWGFGPAAQMGISSTPGMQPIAVSKVIMSNSPLAADLQSCADYQGGEEALASVACPCAMILGGKDKMTPLRAGKAVAEKLDAELTILPQYGHMLPIEAPREVLFALREFIGKQPE